MRRVLFSIGIFSLLMFSFFLTGPKTVHSSGFIANNIFVQSVPTESRAVIIYDGKTETIFDSITFNINPVIAWSFGLVIAVPSEPKVEKVNDEIITKFEKLSEKNLKKSNLVEKVLYFDTLEEDAPKSLYSRPVNLMSFEIFSPDKEISDLEKHLTTSGYVIPKTAYPLLREYKEKKWYFITVEVNANHLQTDASESLTVTGGHTLPLKIEFETDKIIYPLKLATVQPDFDAEDVPLSYSYGESSEKVLGVENTNVDQMLSVQSKNKYPRLPLDYSYHKTELFVLGKNKVSAEGFSTSYAGRLNTNHLDFKDMEGKTYFEEPDVSFLTRLYSFSPTMQLEDVTISFADNNNPVNSKQLSARSKIIVTLLFLVFLSTLAFILIRIKTVHNGDEKKF